MIHGLHAPVDGLARRIVYINQSWVTNKGVGAADGNRLVIILARHPVIAYAVRGHAAGLLADPDWIIA